jgi:Ubiquitin family
MPMPASVRFEEDIMQVFIREIFVRGQEKTLVLEVEKSDTVGNVKSKILKEMGIPKDMQKLRHACLSPQDDEILSHYGIGYGSTLWLRYGYGYGYGQ